MQVENRSQFLCPDCGSQEFYAGYVEYADEEDVTRHVVLACTNFYCAWNGLGHCGGIEPQHGKAAVAERII